MIPSYLNTALRSMHRNMVPTVISIGGLALGMCCVLLIFFYIRFELSYDAFHNKRDLIYQVQIKGVTRQHGATEYRSSVAHELADELLKLSMGNSRSSLSEDNKDPDSKNRVADPSTLNSNNGHGRSPATTKNKSLDMTIPINSFQINAHGLRPTTSNESCNQSVTFNSFQRKSKSKSKSEAAGKKHVTKHTSERGKKENSEFSTLYLEMQNLPRPASHYITDIVRMLPRTGYVRYENRFFKESHFYFTEPAIFRMFDFPLKVGDPNEALSKPGSVVLTPEMADKYFPGESPIGKMICLETSSAAPFFFNGHRYFKAHSQKFNHADPFSGTIPF